MTSEGKQTGAHTLEPSELIDMGTVVIRKQDQHLRIPRRGVVVSIGQLTAKVQWNTGNTTVILVERLQKVIESTSKR